MTPQEEAREREFAGIGHFIASYSRVVSALGALVAFFLNSDEPYAAGMIVSVVPNERRLIQLSKSLAHRYLDGEDLEQLMALLDEAGFAGELRNAVVHTTWLEPTTDDVALLTAKTLIPSDKKPHVGSMREYPPGFLRQRAARLDEIRTGIFASGWKAAERVGRPFIG